MELTELEKAVLRVFKDNELMSLRMITNELNRRQTKVTKQRVWGILQLLIAGNLVEKVDRGIYRKIK